MKTLKQTYTLHLAHSFALSRSLVLSPSLPTPSLLPSLPPLACGSKAPCTGCVCREYRYGLLHPPPSSPFTPGPWEQQLSMDLSLE